MSFWPGIMGNSPRSKCPLSKWLVLTGLLGASILVALNMMPKANFVSRFALLRMPFSTDPLDYDHYVHHLAFSSIHSTLVSQSQVGKITGILASSWTNEDQFRRWTLRIRPGLKFSNGDAITPSVIAQSLVRMAYLMKTRGSKDGVLSHLVGFDSLKSASDQFPGIEVGDETVILQFAEPMPDMLEAISFGLYGIVHPSGFDRQTGKWKDLRSSISSGFYTVESWTENKISIALREDFLADIRHPQAPRRVEFAVNFKPEEVDIADGPEDLGTYRNRLKFSGGSETRIIYIRCERANDAASPCSRPEVVTQLRAAYYSGLRAIGVTPTTSFFPSTISGASQPAPVPELTEKPTIAQSLKTNHFPDLPVDADRSDLRVIHNRVLEHLSRKDGVGLKFEKLAGTPIGSPPLDIRLKMTGVRIDSPVRDVKFMFLSKEGIKLPDLDGSIVAELHRENVDLQKINERLWEQGLIWPVRHVIYGIWYDPSLFDLSRLNTSLPALELQWIGVAASKL